MSQLYRKPLWIGTNVKLVKSEVQSDSDSESDSESEDYINATLTDVYYSSVQLFNPTGGMEPQSTIDLPMFVFTINPHSTFNVPYSRLGDLIKDSRTYDIPNITYVPRYSIDSVVCLSTQDLNTHKYTVVSIHFTESFTPGMVGDIAESNIRYKLKGPLSGEQTIITRTGQDITMLSTNPLAQPEQGGGKRRNKKRTRKRSRKRTRKRSRKRTRKLRKRTRKSRKRTRKRK